MRHFFEMKFCAHFLGEHLSLSGIFSSRLRIQYLMCVNFRKIYTILDW